VYVDDNDGLAPSVTDHGTEDKSVTELGLASASRNENAGDRNNRNRDLDRDWSWGSVEYRKSMLQARSQSEQPTFEVAEMGWTLEPHGTSSGWPKRQSDLIDVGQPTWPYMWAYISMMYHYGR
jgi:hypothetical protein